nr:immunoglobulin light chain junction region [Macaca mulatta]MOW72792.1 immunoglobulin light chain junction region [Macaca mulatta]
CMQALELPYSF